MKIKALLDDYWRKWTLACAVGELIGIGLAGAIAVGLNQLPEEPVTVEQKLFHLGAMLFAGACPKAKQDASSKRENAIKCLFIEEIFG